MANWAVPSRARLRAYEWLKTYLSHVQGMLFANQDLTKAIDQVHRPPFNRAPTTIPQPRSAGLCTGAQARSLCIRDYAYPVKRYANR